MPNYISVNLIPAGDSTNNGWVATGGPATVTECIDDYATGSLVNDSDYARHNLASQDVDYDMFFDLNMHPDVAGADSVSRCAFDFYWSIGTSDDENWIHAAIYDATETTPYVAVTQLAFTNTSSLTYQEQSTASLTITAAGQAASKADWAGAKLMIRGRKNHVMGGDSSYLRLGAIRARFTDLLAGAPTPPAGELLLTPGEPPEFITEEYLPVNVAAIPKTAKMELVSYAPKPPLPFFDEIIPSGQLLLEGHPPQLPFPKPPTAEMVIESYAPEWATRATQAFPGAVEMVFESYAPHVQVDAVLPSPPFGKESFFGLGYSWYNMWTIPNAWDYPGRENDTTLLFHRLYSNAGTNVDPASDYRPGASAIGAYWDNIETGGSVTESGVGGNAVIAANWHYPQDNGDGRTSTGATSTLSDFSSSGGEGVDGWCVFVANHWNEADPNQTALVSSGLVMGNTPGHPDGEVVFLGDGSIPQYGASYGWVHWFYGRDVHNNEGYLFATRTSGSNTVPVVYQWLGGTLFDAGTDILAAVDEPGGNFTTTLVGWCRADQSNPDRVYVMCTTLEGGTNRFKVIAVDLSSIPAYTVVVNDATNYSAGSWNTGQSWDFPEPCIPIERKGIKYFYAQTNNASGATGYTRIILNDANWLAPTIDFRARGGNNRDATEGPPPSSVDPLLSGQSRTNERTYHGIVWLSEGADSVFAVSIRCFLNRSNYTFVAAMSWKDLDKDDPWTDWSIAVIDTYDSTDDVNRHNDQGGIRGWGRGLRGEPTPFWCGQGTYDTSYGGRGSVFQTQIRWWAPRTLTSWQEEASVTIKGGTVVADPVMEYNPSLLIQPASLEATPSNRKALVFDGQYNLNEILQVVDADVTIKPDSVIVFDDTDVNKFIPVTIKPDSVYVDGEAVPANWRIFDINDAHWSQSWTDDLIVLVNVQRVGNGLPPVAAIDNVNMQRYTTNQQQYDTMQVLAEDMARLDTLVADDAGYTIPNQIDRVIKMNPAAVLEYRGTVRVEPITGSPTSGRIIDDGNFPTASEVWNSQSWGAFLVNFFSFDFDDYFNVPQGTHTELYLQVGMAFGPRTGSSDERDIYLAVGLSSYTGVAYEPWGGGGGTIIPTPVDGVRPFETHYWFSGTSWNEEVIDYINDLRASFNLIPFVKPDIAFYQRYAPDMATKHSFNCCNAMYINHNDDTGAFLPVGEQTVSQRLSKMGHEGGGSENIVFGPTGFYINDQDPEQYAPAHFVLSDGSVISPFEAFDAWFNSPGHYLNMIRSWGSSETVVCLLGWHHIFYPEGTTVFDEYHGTYFYDQEGWYSIVTNKFFDADIKMANRVFNTNYQIDGAVIEVLNVSYSLTAFEDVKTALTIEYAMRVTSEQGILWGSRVATDHAIPTFYSLASAHGITYNGTAQVADDHLISYKVDEGVKLAADHTLVHSIRLQSAQRISFGETLQAIAKHRIVFGEYGNVSADHTINYAMSAPAISDHSISYSSTVNVADDHTIDYAISTADTVISGQRILYTIASDSQVEPISPVTITVGGNAIEIQDLTISQDEDSPSWFARARVASNDDYAGLQELQEVVLTISGEEWTLFISEKQLRREFGALDMQIKLESPVALLMNPRALPQTYRYDVATSAQTIVEEILGQSVTWDILAWTVPAGNFVVDDSTPYEAAESLVSAAGGIIQSNKDGTLVVRYRYPVAMNQLQNVTPDQIFTDVEDNISVSNNYEYRTGANRISIGEGDSTFGDSLVWEAEEDDDTKGILKAFLSPWRSSYNLVYTDVDGPVVRVFRGTKQETVTEIVEFVEGSGSTENPIFSVTTVDWLSDVMTAPAFEQFSNSLTVGTGVNQGYGLAEITYVTQYDEYYLNGKLGLHAQFIIEDI